MNTALIDLIELVNDFVLEKTIENCLIQLDDNELIYFVKDKTFYDANLEQKILEKMNQYWLARFVEIHLPIDYVYEREDIISRALEYGVNKTYGEEHCTIDDIQCNYTVGEVFDKDEVVNYVRGNFQIDDLYDKDDIIEFMKDNYDVDDFLDIDIRWRY